jgi:glutamate-1-semialdehyde 2,1-aminomutase
LIHGHCHPRIQAAIEKALAKGASFGISCELEYQLCEKITKCVPSVEMLRLVNSGTEACLSAIRLARAYTGRDLIIKFSGHYHGHADSFLVAAGSGVATLGMADSAGVSEKTISMTQVAEFNSVESIQQLFKTFEGQIAGVILELVSGNMGVVAPQLRFVQELRRLCTEQKSVLIFDEVMTGFRLSKAGAQGLYSISPDLNCFGKVIGGGLPVGAYGGKKEIMQCVAPLGPMYQAGTLSGNPLGAAAGLASIELMEEDEKYFFQSLDHSASQWANYLRSHIEFKGYEACVAQVGSMLTVFFCGELPQNFTDAKKSHLERFKTFFWSLMERGVYYPPSQYESCFLSSQHQAHVMEAVAEASIDAIDRAFEKVP